jgi:hypothetical protein
MVNRFWIVLVIEVLLGLGTDINDLVNAMA